MNNTTKKSLQKNLDEMINEFWNIDCLIRVLREILADNNWDMKECDVETICNILVKTSDSLNHRIKILQLNF